MISDDENVAVERMPRKNTVQRSKTVRKTWSGYPQLSEEDKEKQFLSCVERMWLDLELNENGSIGRKEVKRMLINAGFPCTESHVGEVFEQCGQAKGSLITLKEFETFALRQREKLKKIWTGLDVNGDGWLDETDLVSAFEKLHVPMSESQIRKLLERATPMVNSDSSATVQLSEREFQEFLLLASSSSFKDLLDVWSHASAIDIGETLAATDTHGIQSVITFASGGIAGAVSRSSTAPFDRLKIMLQAGRLRSGNSIGQKMVNIYREGGWKGFWRGNGTNVIKIVPETAMRFFCYDLAKLAICVNTEDPTIFERFMAGAMAGVTSQTIIYPLEIAKTRMAISRQGEFSSLHACIQEAIQSGGWRSLYRGLVPSVIGIVPYSGVDMAVFWTLRARWLETHPNTSKGPSVLTMLGFGAFSSVCGQLASYPMQLVRTRLQAQGMPKNAHFQHYSGMVDCFREIVRNEGLRGIYRGLHVNMIKALPAASISYATFTVVRERLVALDSVYRKKPLY